MGGLTPPSPPYGNKVNLGQDRTATSVDSHTSGYHVCALLDNEDLKCWGENSYGRLGLGDTLSRGVSGNGMGDDLPAVDVGSNRKVIKLVVGALHTCGILDDQSLKCWGYGANHRLGFLPNVYGDNNGNAGDSPNEMGNYLPSVDFGSRPVLDADAGAISTCAIIEDPTDGRQVTCFGFNFEGVLGRGITDVDSSAGGVYMPVNLGTGLYPVQVAIGNDHTCTLLSSGAASPSWT